MCPFVSQCSLEIIPDPHVVKDHLQRPCSESQQMRAEAQSGITPGKISEGSPE